MGDRANSVAQRPYARIKRVLDLVTGVIVLVVSSPVLLAATAAIKVFTPGALLFSQIRSGRDGHPFRIYKLRTMRAGRTPDPEEIVPLNHPEVTRLGRFLRRTKIDELPQIFNVLRGEMSLVGPRPTLPEQVEAYNEFERRRLEVRPGITGLAQVSGSVALSWAERIKYDVYYVDHYSAWLDLSILLRTVLVVFRGEGAFAVPYDKSRYACQETATDEMA